MAAQTLIVADDHPLFRSALVQALRKILPDAQLIEVERGGGSLAGEVLADLTQLLQRPQIEKAHAGEGPHVQAHEDVRASGDRNEGWIIGDGA